MRPELLSPAGSPEALRASVQSGADAVYLGWGDFNARRGAKNFSDEEFSEALLYCHERGVKVYLTLNTLVTDRELPKALRCAEEACRLGVDAVLVQDLGLLALLREALPDLPLHASTQMSLFTTGGACEAAKLGLTRVVLAREMSRDEVAAVCQNCPVEIETFVHGALCLCYSGQCAMSALIGGRSGNRGLCAQPCRLPYGVNAPARGYPLSLKDSSLAESLPELEAAGIACLKLEGRMKRPEYVAVVTSVYSRLLREHRPPTPEERQDLLDAFSRGGFTDWYWRGKKGPGMFGTRPENASEPKELFAAVKAAYDKETQRTVPVRFTCRIQASVPAELIAEDDAGNRVTAFGPVPETARSRPLESAEIADRLKKTGGTAYRAADVSVEIGENLSLPAAALNALRREALAALTERRTAVPERRVLAPSPLPEEDCSVPGPPAFTLSVVRTEQITEELLSCRPARIYVPLELFSSLPSPLPEETEWCAVLPRVWRDADEPQLRELLLQAASLGAGGVLLTNLGQFPLTEGLDLRRYGDFGLNVFNSRTLVLLKEMGLSSATASFELRGVQQRDLKKVLPVEAIVYGRLPLMITENCLIQNSVGCRCEEENYLNDRTGASFPLLPAFGHRTEVENSKLLYLADRAAYQTLGLAYARLRFTTESPEECVSVFRRYLASAPPPEEFTRGLFDRGVD